MRICILTQYYPPEMGAPQARLSDIARRLKHLGHDVQVFTAIPNYPTGKIFEGYPKYYIKEEMNGILIHRSWIIPSKKSSLVHRLISYISFCLSSFFVGLLKVGRVDVIITESPPLFLAITGWILSKLKRSRWILNISDLWPDSAKYIGIMNERNFIYRMLQGLAHFLYRKAWLVTGQSKEIVAEIKRQVPGARTYHLSNGVVTEKFNPGYRDEETRKHYLKDGEVGFVYAGLHGLFQGLDQIILAAERLRDKPIRFVLIGDGAEKESLTKKAHDLGLTNVDFYPPISHENIPSILSSMDVALITLKSTIRGAVPSKIYEAMASGIPILLVADGEARDIVLGAKAGVAIYPGDIDGLVKAVRELASKPEWRREMGKAGRVSAINLYDRNKIAEKFESELRRDLQAI